jgi:hypothetical protein
MILLFKFCNDPTHSTYTLRIPGTLKAVSPTIARHVSGLSKNRFNVFSGVTFSVTFLMVVFTVSLDAYIVVFKRSTAADPTSIGVAFVTTM